MCVQKQASYDIWSVFCLAKQFMCTLGKWALVLISKCKVFIFVIQFEEFTAFEKFSLLTMYFFPLRVIENGEKNRMTCQSIAIIFGPTLLKPEKETGNIAVHTVYQNQIVELILLEINSIFGRWFLFEDNLWNRSRILSDFKSLYMSYFGFGPSSDPLILHFFEGSEGTGRVKMGIRPSYLLLCCKVI